MKDESKNAANEDANKGLSWTQSRLVRITQGGSQGAKASVIGFVLAGPVIGGFLIGYFLDQQFGTQYWVLVIGLLGVFGGFKEMFELLKNMQPTTQSRTPPPGRDKIVPKASRAEKIVEEPKRKEHLFKVPPPPFMESGKQGKTEYRQPQNAEEVLRELMGQDEENEKSDDAK